MVLAVFFTLLMAVLSPTEKLVHPDEFYHFNAAYFYFDHWLPPPVDDQRTLDSYTPAPYGSSYLNEWDIVYLLAGKYAAFVHFIVKDYGIALRLFNVGLFLIHAIAQCYSVFNSN